MPNTDMFEKVVTRKADGLAINGIVVVTAQQNSIANTTAVANSNNVGDLPATVNAILEALRAHGLIASS